MAMELTIDWDFRYAMTCSEPGCDQPPTVKIVAVWSNGPLQERKNYGLACERHRATLLATAIDRRRALIVSEDEQVGPVEVISLGRVAARKTQQSPSEPPTLRD